MESWVCMWIICQCLDSDSIFFFFHWHHSPLWALAYRTLPFHFFLSATSSLHLFLGHPLLLIPSSSWVKIFLGILSSILCRWPNQLTLCPFIHCNVFSPLLISSSSPFVLLFYSPFSYLGSYVLNIFLSKISRACCSFFVNVHAFAPFDTTSLISVLYCIIFSSSGKKSTLEETYSSKISSLADQNTSLYFFFHPFIITE